MEKSFDHKIGMTLVEKGRILVADIKLKEEELGYQRGTEKPRLDKLRTSFEKYGYLEDKRIVLNLKNEPVEGQRNNKVSQRRTEGGAEARTLIIERR